MNLRLGQSLELANDQRIHGSDVDPFSRKIGSPWLLRLSEE
jgi:hypothetical protein